jgi:hypothetical protein
MNQIRPGPRPPRPGQLFLCLGQFHFETIPDFSPRSSSIKIGGATWLREGEARIAAGLMSPQIQRVRLLSEDVHLQGGVMKKDCFIADLRPGLTILEHDNRNHIRCSFPSD